MTFFRPGFQALRRVLLSLAIAVLPVTASRAENAPKGPTIFAAASLKTALDAIAAAWTAQTGHAPTIVYESSGILAKQIEAGAPADLFISADQKWMDALAKDGTLKPATRLPLVGNALVLVAPADSAVAVKIAKGFDLAGILGDGKLAVCSLAACPAGMYGKEALEKLGVFAAVAPKVAEAQNVRAALMLVARGEAPLGIVYLTDARAEPRVKVVATFPDESHSPIVYPVAQLKAATNPDAAAFESFLRGEAATRIFVGQGFVILRR